MNRTGTGKTHHFLSAEPVTLGALLAGSCVEVYEVT